MNGTSLLEARALTKRYGDVVALDRLDLSVGPSEVVCLLGANGAGKTTTLNLFLGFTAPTSGQALVDGRDVAADPAAARAALGYVAEVVALYPLLTGAENLNFFSELAGKRIDPTARDTVLARLRFPDGAIERRANTYSKGMRQKVVLALALARGACVLLLDEPSSGLDPASIEDLNAALENARAQGAAILVVTHDLGQASAIGNRIAFLRRGQLAQVMAREEFAGSDLAVAYARVARAVA